MKQKIIDLVTSTKAKIVKAVSVKELTDLKVEVLGKSGELTLILRGLKDLSEADRPIMGKVVNEARAELEKAIGEKIAFFERKELNEKLLS